MSETPAELLGNAIRRDPTGQSWLQPLLACFPEAHWGASRQSGRLMTSPDASLACTCDPPVRFIWWTDNHRDELDAPPDAGTPVEDRLVLSCCLQTDAFVLAIEDARATRLPTGTTAYTRRHHLSRCIEAVRALADRRLFGVGVVAGPDFSEPQRPVILEGLPHLEREEAEDLYAAYWGWCTIDRLADALAQPTNL